MTFKTIHRWIEFSSFFTICNLEFKIIKILWIIMSKCPCVFASKVLVKVLLNDWIGFKKVYLRNCLSKF